MPSRPFTPTRDKKSLTAQHLKQLLTLSKVDGFTSTPEMNFILAIGEKNGFTKEAIEAMIHDNSPEEFIVPDNDSTRFDHIFNFVQLAFADGVISEEEIDFCIAMAQSLGFRKAIVGVLVRKITMSLKIGKLDKNAIKEEAGNYLVY